jgi:hypothetical protein
MKQQNSKKTTERSPLLSGPTPKRYDSSPTFSSASSLSSSDESSSDDQDEYTTQARNPRIEYLRNEAKYFVEAWQGTKTTTTTTTTTASETNLATTVSASNEDQNQRTWADMMYGFEYDAPRRDYETDLESGQSEEAEQHGSIGMWPLVRVIMAMVMFTTGLVLASFWLVNILRR